MNSLILNLQFILKTCTAKRRKNRQVGSRLQKYKLYKLIFLSFIQERTYYYSVNTTGLGCNIIFYCNVVKKRNNKLS